MMNKDQKKNYISEMTTQFENSKAIMVTHYQGLTMTQLDDLRSKMRESNYQAGTQRMIWIFDLFSYFSLTCRKQDLFFKFCAYFLHLSKQDHRAGFRGVKSKGQAKHMETQQPGRIK